MYSWYACPSRYAGVPLWSYNCSHTKMTSHPQYFLMRNKGTLQTLKQVHIAEKFVCVCEHDHALCYQGFTAHIHDMAQHCRMYSHIKWFSTTAAIQKWVSHSTLWEGWRIAGLTSTDIKRTISHCLCEHDHALCFWVASWFRKKVV